MDKEKIKLAIKFATSNKDALGKSKYAACYYCQQVFLANEVVEFLEVENTALCPKCGIDSVLPDTSGYEFTKENLLELHKFWFS